MQSVPGSLTCLVGATGAWTHSPPFFNFSTVILTTVVTLLPPRVCSCSNSHSLPLSTWTANDTTAHALRHKVSCQSDVEHAGLVSVPHGDPAGGMTLYWLHGNYSIRGSRHHIHHHKVHKSCSAVCNEVTSFRIVLLWKKGPSGNGKPVTLMWNLSRKGTSAISACPLRLPVKVCLG